MCGREEVMKGMAVVDRLVVEVEREIENFQREGESRIDVSHGMRAC